MVQVSRANSLFFFFNDTATTEIYTLSLHDALPILHLKVVLERKRRIRVLCRNGRPIIGDRRSVTHKHLFVTRSEEHTSELQSRLHLVCRLLLEKKKKMNMDIYKKALIDCSFF